MAGIATVAEESVKHWSMFSRFRRTDRDEKTVESGGTQCLGSPDSESLRGCLLVYPRCQGEVRFMAVIEEVSVIERILRHIGAWDPSLSLRSPPMGDIWPKNSQIPLTYHPVRVLPEVIDLVKMG